MSAAKLFMSIFGFSGIQYESFQEENNTLIFNASTTKKKEPCPHCGSFNNHFKGTKTRMLRMIPLNRHKCYLKLTLHRIYCLDCRRCTWPSLTFVSGKERMVKAFVQYVLDLLQLGTILSVAQILGVGWDLVKNIHKNHLRKKYRKIPFSSLRYLSVDEFSIRKGHTYMTIFVDIETGRIIFATEGRRRENILPFLRRLAKKAPQLQAIAMDMSLPYYSAVQEALPNVDVVFDHFHVNVLINKALDDIRKQQQHKNIRSIKGQRFLLLKNYGDLNELDRNRLQRLFQVNEPLFIAHSLKEQFRLIWEQPTKEKAAIFFLIWFWDVHLSGIRPLIRAAKTLLKYSQGIMNYFKHRISNGKIEGINNKIKTMKRQSYGFRDNKYFILRLYHLHEQRYSLAG